MVQPFTKFISGRIAPPWQLTRTRVVTCLLLAAVGFNLWHLFPEINGNAISSADRVFHLLLAESAVDAFIDGRDPTDPWSATMSLGFPLFHYYQHLPHISVALVHLLSLQAFLLVDILNWSTYLLLSIFPLSVYWSSRRLGFGQLTSSMAGAISPVIGTDFELYGGLGYWNYTFSGVGLYAQLWGMVMLPPALALGYRVVLEGRGYFWAMLLLAMTLMSHLVYGYMAFITLGFLTFVNMADLSNMRSLPGVICLRWARLLALFVLVGLVTSYFLGPFFLDREYFYTSVLSKQTLMDSFGHQVVLEALVKGDLFDSGRFPSFTILVLAGLLFCVLKFRVHPYGIPITVFLLWLLLFFGRSTWGPLVDLFPLMKDVHMHRFVAGVHLGGIMLAAVALGTSWSWVISRTNPWYTAGIFLVTLTLLAPVYIERRSHLEDNRVAIEKARTSFETESENLNELFESLRQLPPGRILPLPSKEPDERSSYPLFVSLHEAGFDVLSHEYHRYSAVSDVLIAFDDTDWEQYNLFNVRYVVSLNEWEPPDFAKLSGKFDRYWLYQIETTGYFDLVGSDKLLAGDEEDFLMTAVDWMRSDNLQNQRYPEISIGRSSNSDRSASLPTTTSDDHDTSAIPGRGTVYSEQITASSFEGMVDVKRESVLLIKVPYHPNWKAKVDGVSTTTTMLMPGFTGIYLSPGIQEIVVEYRTQYFRKILLGFGVFVLLVIGICERQKRSIPIDILPKRFARLMKFSKTRQSSRANRRRARRRNR